MQVEDMKGFLKKLKTSRLGRLFGNTNMRWFECLFKEKVFGYKDKSQDLKIRSSIKFEEITDFSDRLSLEDAKMCDWNHGFQIITKNRVYILYCQTRESLDKWVVTFNIILKRGPKKLAVIQTPNFNSLKPKQEQQPQKKIEEKPVKIVEVAKQPEVKPEVIELKLEEIVVKPENNRKSVTNAPPENKTPPKRDMIELDEDELIVAEYEENREVKPKALKREEYQAEKPKHNKNIVPQLLIQKKELKTAVLKDEFDDNIENLILEADKSFDNVVNANSNLNDKYYKHTKKTPRSSSAVAMENPGQTSNILKSILQKDQAKKSQAALAGERIHDWNYYDREGRIVKEEESYNPATVNEGSKETREEKKKKKTIANLLNGGVHLGIDIDEEENTTNMGKSMIKDNNRSYLSKQVEVNVKQQINNKSIIEENVENNIFAELASKESKKEDFVAKSILESTVLYDNRKPANYSRSTSNIEDRIKIVGMAHPEIRRTVIVDDHKELENRMEHEIDDEINKFFDENKQKVQESKYSNKPQIEAEKKPLKIFKKLDDDFEDFDYHNQKKSINSSNKVVIAKPNNNISVLLTQNNIKQIQNNNENLNHNNLLGNLGVFDSNPEFSNNLYGGQNANERHGSIINFQVKNKKTQNVNSSFIEDLTDDWKEEKFNKQN